MATEKRMISLDEAIAKIKDDGILGAGYDDAEREDDVIDMLESCHIVDAVEVVHGRWIEKQEQIPWCEDDVDVFDVCSVCDCASPGKSNYCPNCGAKMDGDGNG